MLRGTWDLPGPGFEPMSPALSGRFLSTAPPGMAKLFKHIYFNWGKSGGLVWVPLAHPTLGSIVPKPFVLIPLTFVLFIPFLNNHLEISLSFGDESL